MCGRYYVDDETLKDIERIAKVIDNTLQSAKNGDVYPTERAAVITGSNEGVAAKTMRWGFPAEKSRTLINARAETVLERKLFSDSVRYRRCIIPAKIFYEWDYQKNKVSFSWKDSKTLFLAGFYNSWQNEDRFVILTTKANASMRSVHDRMPLILAENTIEGWLYQNDKVEQYLSAIPPMLDRRQEYEQLNLFS